MTLYVDIGNTSVSWVEAGAQDIGQSRRFIHAGSKIAGLLDSHWATLQPPGQVICSCVAGTAFERALTRWCRSQWNIKPVYIRAVRQAHGVTNAYLQPERLGADRWVALVAAHGLLTGPCCIIDCGTALTVDAIQSDGVHLGGLIMPGLRLMRDCLSDRTAVVAGESEGDNTTLFARNTADAISGGALYAQVATVDRIFNDVEQTLATRINRILTGGDAEDLLPLLGGQVTAMPDLVLQGLAIIHQSMQDRPEEGK